MVKSIVGMFSFVMAVDMFPVHYLLLPGTHAIMMHALLLVSMFALVLVLLFREEIES